jgi:RHS repeat-associated protein
MQARYYDATIARFLSTDPAPVNGGDLYSFSLYGYANGNQY